MTKRLPSVLAWLKLSSRGLHPSGPFHAPSEKDYRCDFTRDYIPRKNLGAKRGREIEGRNGGGEKERARRTRGPRTSGGRHRTFQSPTVACWCALHS